MSKTVCDLVAGSGLAFTDRGGALRPLAIPPDAEPASDVPVALSGDVVVTVSPAGLLAGVLGRVARAVAGRTHLSLDHFSDIYLATDAIAAFADSTASAAAITFALAAGPNRLELTVGPFSDGNGERLLQDGLSQIAGDFSLEAVDGYEFLRFVVDERRGPRRESPGR